MPAKKDNRWKILAFLPALILFVSLVGGWYTIRADAAYAKKTADDNTQKITQMQIEQAAEDKTLENINKNLEEIKKQTKEIPNIQSDIAVLKERTK